MRNVKYIKSIILLASILISYGTKAQHVGKIDNFEILTSYLEDGKVKISSEATTTIKYKVTFVREIATTTPTLTWKPFNMTIRLSTPSADGNIVLLEEQHKIISSDFPNGIAFLRDKEFTATIDNSKLNPNRPIILSYTINDAANPIYSYNDKLYYPKIEGTVVPPSTNPSELYPVYMVSWYDGGNMLTGTPNPGPNQRPGAIVFYVRSSLVPGSKYFTEYRRDNGSVYPKYDYLYDIASPGAGWNEDPLKGLWTYDIRQQGTVPVYKYANDAGKNIFYSTEVIEGEGARYNSLGIAFYAFPVAKTPRLPAGTRPDRGTTGYNSIYFSVNLDQWVQNTDGSYSFDLEQVVPSPASIDISAIILKGDLVPPDPNNPRPPRGDLVRELIQLPGTYHGSTFNIETINGSVYIVCRNTSNVAPVDILNFTLSY